LQEKKRTGSRLDLSGKNRGMEKKIRRGVYSATAEEGKGGRN